MIRNSFLPLHALQVHRFLRIKFIRKSLTKILDKLKYCS